jgi:hypothetical protein
MLYSANLLQLGAFLAETIECNIQLSYRMDFARLQQEIGLSFDVNEDVSRIITVSLVFAPSALAAMTPVLDARFAHEGTAVELPDGGRFYVEPQGDNTLIFYMLLPVSVLGMPAPKSKRTRQPRRKRARGKGENAPQDLDAKRARMDWCATHGHYEEAARLRDEIQRAEENK